MKRILFVFVAGFIPALAATNQTYAQTSRVVASAQYVNQFSSRTKTPAFEKSTILNERNVNIKAVRNFLKLYHVNNEKWSEAENGVVASFTSAGIFTVVYYDNKGHWEDFLKGYTEDKMDPDVREIVKQTYYDYKIGYVQEIETTDNLSKPAYFVHIENDKNVKTILINNGEMAVYEEYKRTN